MVYWNNLRQADRLQIKTSVAVLGDNSKINDHCELSLVSILTMLAEK
jgi:hypothetical protein